MATTEQIIAAFKLGIVVVTPGAEDALAEVGSTGVEYLDRHHFGDWGTLSDNDKSANEFGVENGERILSAYILESGQKIWIITERDRSATTIMTPEEY